MGVGLFNKPTLPIAQMYLLHIGCAKYPASSLLSSPRVSHHPFHELFSVKVETWFPRFSGCILLVEAFADEVFDHIQQDCVHGIHDICKVRVNMIHVMHSVTNHQYRGWMNITKTD